MPIPILPISATPGPRLVPKAGADGKLLAGWIPDLSGTYQPLNTTLTTLSGKAFQGSGDIVLATSPTLTNPVITGGTINNTPIGGTTPAAVTGTTGRFNSDLTLAGAPGKIKPAANSTTALQLTNVAGASIVNIDTTNNRVGINTSSAPLRALQVANDGILVGAAESGVDYMRLLASNGSGEPELTLFNTGSVDAKLTSRNLVAVTGSTGFYINVSVEATGVITGRGLVSYGGTSANVAPAAGTLRLMPANGGAASINFIEQGAAFRGSLGYPAGSSDLVLDMIGTGAIGSGTEVLRITSAGIATHKVTDAATNSVTNTLILGHNGGTIVAGFGTGLLFQAENSGANDRSAALIEALWNDPTNAAAIADFVFSAYFNNNGSLTKREGIRIRGGASATQIGFFGVTPVTRPTALTTQLTTITHTAPGTPDYALQNLTNSGGYGFATLDEGNTFLSVVANLQTRVAQLETKLQSLGLVA